MVVCVEEFVGQMWYCDIEKVDGVIKCGDVVCQQRCCQQQLVVCCFDWYVEVCCCFRVQLQGVQWFCCCLGYQQFDGDCQCENWQLGLGDVVEVIKVLFDVDVDMFGDVEVQEYVDECGSGVIEEYVEYQQCQVIDM